MGIDKKLYYVYFRGQNHDTEPEFDGVIYLTEAEAGVLKDMGFYDQEHGGESEFDIHPVTPYTFDEVQKQLAQYGPEDEPNAWKGV